MIQTQHDQVRYVAFPPDGKVSTLNGDRAWFNTLRENSPQWRDALDVTPSPCAVAVNTALGLNTWWRHGVTSLRCFPCPDCDEGKARWVVCETCHGSRRAPSLAWELKRG